MADMAADVRKYLQRTLESAGKADKYGGGAAA